MTSELEQIRARKMAEMMEQAEGRQRLKTRGPVELTDGSFAATIRRNSLVVVDCWAAWCYPCKRIAPIMEELANEYSSAVMFAKLNVDDNPRTALAYSVQSIPTILVIKDGVEVERIVGAVPKSEIENALRKHL